MRHGLQLFGVQIVADTEAEERGRVPLRLANADLPFSLRFIGCTFHMPLAFSSARLVTLDLSGSALPGLDASFLKLAGSLRLRRTYASAPLDFTGATIHGFLDGADMVLQPFGPLPSMQASDSHRAMLGLNQVRIDNEIRLQRAQIWGGVTMRGLVALRSIYLSDAVLLSPLGVLEALAYKATKGSDANSDEIYKLPGLDANDETQNRQRDVNEETWKRGWKAELIKFCRTFATPANVSTQTEVNERTAFNALMVTHLRARTSALRADGMQVGGSIYMERSVFHGRVRLKYVQVKGGLTLAGAKLRSTEAMIGIFDSHAYDDVSNAPEIATLCAYRKKTYEKLVEPQDRQTGRVARGADIFALDLRESRFEGDVRIGIYESSRTHHDSWDTQIDGVVTCDQAVFDGKLRMERVKFRWTVRVPELSKEVLPTERPYAHAYTEEEDRLKLAWKEGKAYQLSARGLTTADSVSLTGVKRLKGADFSNATIGGDLLFWADWEHPDAQGKPERDRIKLKEPASDLGGATINIAGATLDGDVRLLFEPAAKTEPEANNGPSIQAERVTIKGLLSIMPPGSLLSISAGTYQTIVDDAADDRTEIRQWAGEGQVKWRDKMDARAKQLPMINLSNAQATLFESPPAAWPKSGQLLVSGFVYQRAMPIGPLGPPPTGKDGETPRHFKTRSQEWWAITVVLLVAAGAVWGWRPQLQFDQGATWPAVDLLFWLLVVAAIYILIPFIGPRSSRTVPMAHAWLGLQLPERNPYRTRYSLRAWAMTAVANLFKVGLSGPKTEGLGNIFFSLEPYTTAADALRREGRWISANLVEQERFRVRNWQLSGRLHLLQKIAFKVAQLVTGYGYNYARLAFLTSLCIVVTAMVAEHANYNGAISAKITKVNPVPDVKSMSAFTQPSDGAEYAEDCGKKHQIIKTNGFDAALFAIDTVLPLIELAEVSEWEVAKQCRPPPLGRDSIVTYARLFGVLHALGIILIGILLLGLSTRFGSWLGRYGD